MLLLHANANKNNKSGTSITPTAQKKTIKTKKTQQSQTFLYGTWTSQSSTIRAVDLATSQATTIAILPLTIKKISVLSNDSLLYIDQTDKFDHGQRISVFNIKEKQITINIPAASGFGIDNYVLSPNKQFIVLWEVAFGPDGQTLQGGQSRIYGIDLTKLNIINLLYDEKISPTIPIHYPIAVLNDGTVFTDQSIPTGAKNGNWAYGMSTVDLDGTNKQDITSMPNGTYGSQPSLSPDGKYLLFAGYDNANGDGTKVTNGFKQAVLTPDTVELLDTKTLNRYKLPNLPNTNIYSDIQWDKQTANVIFSILSADNKNMGIYAYDLAALRMTQIALPSANGTPYGYISQLPGKQTLIGIQSTDAANLGNLGETYSQAYTQLAILTADNTLSYVSIEDPFIQYIAILPGNYYKNVLGASTNAKTGIKVTPTSATSQSDMNATPQNYSFFLKTTLASLRLQEKNITQNPCNSLEAARCSALGLTKHSTAYAICQHTENLHPLTVNACY